MNILLSAFAPEKLASRDGSGRPVRVSLLISISRLNPVLTDFFPSSAAASIRLFKSTIHTPSGHSRVYRVTHLRADGVDGQDIISRGTILVVRGDVGNLLYYWYNLVKNCMISTLQYLRTIIEETTNVIKRFCPYSI